VQLSFENINSPELGEYGVDHLKVAEGLGCKAIRVRKQEEIDPAIEQAEKWMTQYKVRVVIEIMLERVTNIPMGTEIDNVIEFEELAQAPRMRPMRLDCWTKQGRTCMCM
jgi:tartronate-semialdehyde synthase